MVKKYDRNYPTRLWFDGRTHLIRCSNFDTTPKKMRAMLKQSADAAGISVELRVKHGTWLSIKAYNKNRADYDAV